MPRGNRTGPTGTGAMTGRHMGICAGATDSGFIYDRPKYGKIEEELSRIKTRLEDLKKTNDQS